MSEFDDPENWRFTEILKEAPYARIAFEHQPQIAYEVALFIGCFAMVELTTWRLLSASCGIPQGQAEEMLLPLRNYASRLDRIGAEMKRSSAAQHYITILSNLRELNAVRNAYVHAQYGFRPDKAELLRVSWLPSTRKTEDAVITRDAVRDDVREAKRLVVQLFDMPIPPAAGA